MPGVKSPTLLLSVTDVDETTQAASLSKSIQVDISEPFHVNNSVTYSPLQHGRTPLLSLGNALEELYKADVVTTVALGAAAGEDIVIRKVRYVLSVSDESRGKGDAQLTAPFSLLLTSVSFMTHFRSCLWMPPQVGQNRWRAFEIVAD
jgi:hypothetical protein